VDGGGAEGEAGVARYGTDAWVRPPRIRIQASVGSTAAHEGGLNPTRGTEDPTPRWSESSANAKRPLSMKGVSDRTSRCWSRSSGGSGLGGSCPGGPTRRRERKGPTKTGAGEATEASEVGHIGRVGGEHPRHGREPRSRGECDTPKRRHGCACAPPPPVSVVGPKTHRDARGVSFADSAGSQRVRVIVVESLGSRHRTNASNGACPAGRRKAQRWRGSLARRRPVPGWEKS